MPAQADDLDLRENNGRPLLIATAVLLSFSWISVLSRTFTRAVLIKSFQVDDWFMLASQLVFTATCAFILRGIKDGMGFHNAAIKNKDDEVRALMWQALATSSYILNMMLIKLSIGLFLFRLTRRKLYTWILRISLTIIVIWSSATFIFTIVQCIPVAKQWDDRIMTGHCVTPDQFVQAAYAFSVMSILSDWLYALLPIPMLWSVEMTKQAKITVIFILGLGIFASIATLIRLKFLSGVEQMDDILFAGTDTMIWTLVEPGVAIFAASIATIRPLLRSLRIRGFEPSYGPSFRGHQIQESPRSRSSRRGSVLLEAAADPAGNTTDLSSSEPVSVTSSNAGLDVPVHKITFKELNKDLPTLPPPSAQLNQGHRSSTIRIEMLPMQVGTDSSILITRLASPGSPSFDQIHKLQAQNQERILQLSRPMSQQR